ncbi:MAG: glycosyltransferase family 2 protein [Candidatus Omnitrophica bacterium]|nr:glycosyltransferase family 2 protein [Candidatus Omnitrophota bacterium]
MKEKKFSISFVLPMYNERDNIAGTIMEIRSIGQELADDYEIVVVDDASSDGSADIVEEIAKSDGTVKVFRLAKNSKFGGAFARGFKSAEKDVIIYMDSDMPVEREDIKTSLPLIENSDIVTGYSRIKKGDTLRRKIISGTYNFMVQALFRLSVKDINSGYKIVKREVVKNINFISQSPFVDVELFIHAKKKGFSVRQFPLVFRSRSGGKSHIARLPVILATFRDMVKVKFYSYRIQK